MSLQFFEDRQSDLGTDSAQDIYSLCWLPDEDVILGGSSDGELHGWHATSGQHLGQAKESVHGFGLHYISASSRNRTVLTASMDGTIAVWDVSRLRDLAARQQEGASNGEGSMQDGETSSTAPLPLRLLHKIAAKKARPDGEEMLPADAPDDDEDLLQSAEVLPSEQARTYAAVIHPSLERFISTGIGASLTVHTFGSRGKERFGATVTHIKPFDNDPAKGRDPDFGICLSLHEKGHIAVVGSSRGRVYLYDVTAGRCMDWISAGDSPIRCLHFTARKELLVGKADGNVRVYDVRQLLALHPDATKGEMEADEDEDLMESIDDGLGHFAEDFSQSQSSRYTGSQTTADWSSQARSSSSSSQASQSARRSSPFCRYVRQMDTHSLFLTNVKASSDGRILATAAIDGHIRMWDLANLYNRQALWSARQEREVWCLAWKPPRSEHFEEADRQPPAKRPKTVAVQSGAMSTAAQSVQSASAFVTAGADGKIRWYRQAGGGAGDEAGS